jgi:sulfonate transport system substrate-binding protein
MHLRRQRRHSIVIAALCAFALVASACGDDTSSAPTTSAPTGDLDLSGVPLRVGVQASAGSIRQAIYRESGAFDDVAYRVEWVDFDSSNVAIEALNAGAIDVAAVIMATVVVLAQGNAVTPWTEETAPFTVIDASVPVNDPGFQLLVAADSEIESITDLSGRSIAYSRGAIGHYFLVRLMGDSGLGQGDIEEVQLPPGEGRAAFVSGAVDALIAGYRNSLPLIASGDARVLTSSSAENIPIHSVTLARAGLLDDPAREAAVGDLLDRIDASEVWAATNVDELTEIYQTVANFDAPEARVAAESDPKRRVPLDDAVVSALQDQAEVFAAAGVITSEVDVSVLFDRRFATTGSG